MIQLLHYKNIAAEAFLYSQGFVLQSYWLAAGPCGRMPTSFSELAVRGNTWEKVCTLSMFFMCSMYTGHLGSLEITFPFIHILELLDILM